MGTKNNPGKFDCYANAGPDEPMFILLARDPAAPALVRAWAEMRKMLIISGVKPIEDAPMLQEAHECADAMEQFAYRRRLAKEAEVRRPMQALFALMDDADEALDKDSFDQLIRDDFDPPLDAEYSVRAGTIIKCRKLFDAIEALRKAATSPMPSQVAAPAVRRASEHDATPPSSGSP